MFATVKVLMLFCHPITLLIDDFKILATSDSDFHVKVKESLSYHVMNPSKTTIKRHYLFTYFIGPSHAKLFFNDIYYCYNCCINLTIVI